MGKKKNMNVLLYFSFAVLHSHRNSCFVRSYKYTPEKQINQATHASVQKFNP